MKTSADCTARAAAQLREAARDVALVAERRTRRAAQAQQETAAITADEPPARNPNGVMRLVAARLTAAGFDTRQDDSDSGSELSIGCDGAWCIAWAGESGHDEWEWHPAGGTWTDPKQAADLATVLLTGAGSDLARQGDAYGRPGIAFKGIVGTELAARGLSVHLGVYEDHRTYDVTAEVVAVNPARPQAGTVYVTDSGTLTWACDHWRKATADTPPPAGQPPVEGPEAATAAAVANTVISAMILARLASAANAAPRTGERT